MIGAKGKKVLILGGAEGCVTREILKWNVESVTQVDWDFTLVEQFKNRPWTDSYTSSKLSVVYEEALKWMIDTTEVFDYIFIDLIDPSESNLDFFQKLLVECKRSLAPGGGLSINAGVVREKFTSACTLTSVMKGIFSDSLFGAMRVSVPSFRDEWGFLMVLPRGWSERLYETSIPSMTYFSREKLIDAMNWPSSYPDALRNFWKDTSPKKLTVWNPSFSVDLETHYGC
jgi:predicted membrane-bound spermidine synthase